MKPERFHSERIYVYRDPVNMRKSINGLSALVLTELDMDPLDGSLFVFINKRRDKVKLLLWQVNGYWLLYKKLERQRFKWPDWFAGSSLVLTMEQLDYLLDGYDLNGMRPHQAVRFVHAF